jgi:hypothetical protein
VRAPPKRPRLLYGEKGDGPVSSMFLSLLFLLYTSAGVFFILVGALAIADLLTGHSSSLRNTSVTAVLIGGVVVWVFGYIVGAYRAHDAARRWVWTNYGRDELARLSRRFYEDLDADSEGVASAESIAQLREAEEQWADFLE